RLLDMLGRREVGLADAEADDVLALARERVHLREDDEGVLGAKALGAPADFWHGCPEKALIMPPHAGQLRRLRAGNKTRRHRQKRDLGLPATPRLLRLGGTGR